MTRKFPAASKLAMLLAAAALVALGSASASAQSKPKYDKEGALVLVGVFKTDELQVKYNLRYVQNDGAWKMIGLNVDATKKRQ